MAATLGPMGQLECVDLVERVTDYLDGSLDAGMRERLAAHIGRCWACGHYVGGMTVTVRLMAELPPERLRSDLESSLLDMFRAELRPSPVLD